MIAISILCVFSLFSFFCGESPRRPHVRTGNTVEYYLNNEANLVTEISVRDTFERWSKATHFKFIYKGRTRAGICKDSKNTISFLVKWPSEIPVKKIAYCCNWYNRNGEIVESDIIFNMSLVRFTTLLGERSDSYTIEGVLSHEIGHMIGLEHIDNERSLMKNQSSPKESFLKGKIDQLTLKEYRRLYHTSIQKSSIPHTDI